MFLSHYTKSYSLPWGNTKKVWISLYISCNLPDLGRKMLPLPPPYQWARDPCQSALGLVSQPKKQYNLLLDTMDSIMCLMTLVTSFLHFRNRWRTYNLRISSRIFENSRNAENRFTRGPGESDSWKNLGILSWHHPFKQEKNHSRLQFYS